jgi:hypothetical protein
VSGLPGEAEHHLGVDEVLRTPERDDTYFHGLTASG